MTELKVRPRRNAHLCAGLGTLGLPVERSAGRRSYGPAGAAYRNAMLGNPEGAAALEVTLLGPELEVCGGGAAVFAGADLGFSVNGRTVGSWRVVELKDGDVISFTGPKKRCRGNLCFAGGRRRPLS